MLRCLSVIFCLFFTVSSFGQIDGIVANYSFNDGTADDQIGNNHAKAVGATLVKDRFGNPKSAYYFHGTYGSYINLGTSTLLKPKSGSISLWLNIDNKVYSGTGAEFNPVIITKCQPGDDFFEGYCIGYNLVAKKISVVTTLSEESQVTLRSADTTLLHSWYHVVMTYDDSLLCLYVNGILENKIAKNFKSKFLDGDSVMIAYSANYKNQRFFNGSIDDIAIYNKVLTPKEVDVLYHAPNPNKNWVFLQWFIYIGLAILGITLTGLFINWRLKRIYEKENEKNSLLNHSYELEIKALKAQMNPHFVFNSLNSIQKFILTNDNEKAQLYLTKFARLLRKLLESNTQENISLDEEINMLSMYLEIESLRFDNIFKHSIEIDPGIDSASIFIPHFLIQPFVENAIWHGLLPKKGDKTLLMKFEIIDENTLSCIVDDNGVGRKESSSKNEFEKGKSLAISFIQQRLELASKMNKTQYSVKIIDKVSETGDSNGTMIILTLPLIKL